MKHKKLNPLEKILLNYTWLEIQLEKFDDFMRKQQFKIINQKLNGKTKTLRNSKKT